MGLLEKHVTDIKSRGVTVHKIQGTVRYDAVVSRFGTFSRRGAGQLFTLQTMKMSQCILHKHTFVPGFVHSKIYAGEHLNQSFHYKQKMKV